MAQVFHTISLIAFGMAGITFVAAIVLWFRFGIWNIIGELSGRMAKKSIKQMREENSKGIQRLYDPSARIVSHLNTAESSVTNTADVQERRTTLLKESEETMVLQEEGTTVLEETMTELYEETDELEPIDILSEEKQTVELPVTEVFEVIENILLIHTEEQIQGGRLQENV